MTGVPHIEGRWWGSTSASVAAHAALFALMTLIAARVSNLSDPPHALTAGALVFVPEAGGGGGGGGDTSAQLPRPALMGRAAPAPMPSASDITPPPVSPPSIAASSVETIPGAPTPLDSLGTAAGKGDGPGGDNGRGGGNGPGAGSGDGDGKTAGVGGDALPGNGVSNPVLVREVKPNYTADAMRAKIQGTVEIEAVVRADGTIDPRSIRIVRSLDSTFGLDREAIEAIKQWRFRPAVRKGQAVASFVTLELVFTLR